MKKAIYLPLMLLLSTVICAQCEVHNRVQADGSMLYFMHASTFYTTKSKSLKIGILTDKENYFIALQPTPFPAKDAGVKIKDDLEIELANNKKYKLAHYDTNYIHNDSIMQVLYLIDSKDLKDFSSFEAVSANINMKGTEFVRNYAFKLHKKAIMQQLSCFLKEEE